MYMYVQYVSMYVYMNVALNKRCCFPAPSEE